MDDPGDKDMFELQLFVVGRSAKAEAAISNLRAMCERFLKGRYDITVIDVLEDPVAAEKANVIATPLLIRNAPPPRRRIVGDLSMTNVLLHGLGIDIERPLAPRRGDKIDG